MIPIFKKEIEGNIYKNDEKRYDYNLYSCNWSTYMREIYYL